MDKGKAFLRNVELIDVMQLNNVRLEDMSKAKNEMRWMRGREKGER